MPVNLLPISQKFYNQLNNEIDFSSETAFSNNLSGVIGEVQKFYQKIRVSWNANASEYNVWIIFPTGETNQYEISQQTGDFRIDGFSAGDTIRLVTYNLLGENPLTTAGVIDTVSELSCIFTLTSGDVPYQVVNKGNINGTSPLTALVYSFGLVPNNDNFNITSLVSGNDQQFYADGIGLEVDGNRSTDWVTMKPQSKYRDWLLKNYGCRVKYVSTSGYNQFFEIEHSFIIDIEKFYDFVKAGVTPDLFKGQNSLKYVFSVDFRTVLSNPMTTKYKEYTLMTGSVGWYGETFNGFELNYQIDKVSFKDADTDGKADAILMYGKTTVTIELSSINDSITSDCIIIPTFQIFPESQADYQDTITYLDENFLFDNFRGSADDNLTGTGIFKRVYSYLDGGRAIIEVDIEFSDSQRKLITSDTKYLLSLIVGNSTLENKFSDRGNLIVSIGAFDNSADIDGLFEVTEMRIVRHNETL